MSAEQPNREPADESARPVHEPAFNIPAIVVAFAALCILVHVLRAFISPDQDAGIIIRFAFFPIRYTGGYDWDVYAWLSPLTYSFLHGDLAHLTVNMVWLVAFGSPLANRIGPLAFCLFWALTALAAVALHFALHPGDAIPLVGASGAISGMMGAAARFGFDIDRTGRKPAFATDILPMSEVFRSRAVLSFLGIWLLINFAMGIGFGTPGMSGQIAWEAHIGGLVAGFFGIGLFPGRRRPTSK